MRSTHRGLTLVEVLIASALVGSVGIGAGKIITIEQKKDEVGDCQDNLHRIAGAVQMYELDNGGRFPFAIDYTDAVLGNGGDFPTGNYWVSRLKQETDPIDQKPHGGFAEHVLRSYLPDDTAWQCPSDDGIGGVGYLFVSSYARPYTGAALSIPVWQHSRDDVFPGATWGGSSYLYNTVLGLWGAEYGKSISQVAQPNTCFVFQDAAHYWHEPLKRLPIQGGPGNSKDLTDYDQGSFNVLFADSHVAQVTTTQFETDHSLSVHPVTLGFLGTFLSPFN